MAFAVEIALVKSVYYDDSKIVGSLRS